MERAEPRLPGRGPGGPFGALGTCPLTPTWVRLSVVTLAGRPGEAEAPRPGARRTARRCSCSLRNPWAGQGEANCRTSATLASPSNALRRAAPGSGPAPCERVLCAGARAGLGWAGRPAQFGASEPKLGWEPCRGWPLGRGIEQNVLFAATVPGRIPLAILVPESRYLPSVPPHFSFCWN